jgi:hypothetical protein
MSARRSRGDGGLYWSECRQRWIAEITVGYTSAGKRITRKAAGRTKTEAKAKLKEALRDLDDGLTPTTGYDTVASAVHDWLAFGLAGRDPKTIETKRILAEKHIVSLLGARKLRELSADDVDRWLANRAKHVSTRTLQELRSILKRAITRAQARDKVRRNVVMLCELPKGKPGRPSKSLTLTQAEAVLTAAEQAKPWLAAYVALSLLTGARTEELRELAWSHVVAYDNDRQEWRPVIEAGWEHQEFAVYVWRSVRASGDTKMSRVKKVAGFRCGESWGSPGRHGRGRPRSAGSWRCPRAGAGC